MLQGKCQKSVESVTLQSEISITSLTSALFLHRRRRLAHPPVSVRTVITPMADARRKLQVVQVVQVLVQVMQVVIEKEWRSEKESRRMEGNNLRYKCYFEK